MALDRCIWYENLRQVAMNALYLWCLGLCKMEKMSGKQRNRKPRDDRGLCPALQGSPQKAPVESSELMHFGHSDFVISAL